MKRSAGFEVFSHGNPIGRTAFEHRDPPMGVAFGRFLPGPGYTSIQGAVRRTLRSADRVEDQKPLGLSVRTEAGLEIHSDNGVSIADGSTDFDPDDIEIEMLGVSDYERHFGRGATSDA